MNRDVAEHIRGLARAAEYIEAERIERLARLTPEAARALYHDLIEGWERRADEEAGLERLAAWRLESKLALRRSFMRLYQARQAGRDAP